jgi:hypothetical protein
MITHHKSSDWVGTKIMYLRTARQTDHELGGKKKLLIMWKTVSGITHPQAEDQVFRDVMPCHCVSGS